MKIICFSFRVFSDLYVHFLVVEAVKYLIDYIVQYENLGVCVSESLLIVRIYLHVYQRVYI